MAKQPRSKRQASGTSRKSASRSRASSTSVLAKLSKKPAVQEPAPGRSPLPSSLVIARKAGKLLWRHRSYFVLLAIIYLLLDLLFVRSIAGFDVADLKASLATSLHHGAGQAIGSVSVLASLFTTAAGANANDAAGAYHFFLVLLISLVVVWSLRQIFTSDNLAETLHIKKAFYQSTAQLVPFLLLVCLMGLQFIPLFAGLEVYAITLAGGVTVTVFEHVLFVGMLLALSGLTLHWLTRTIVALYIVTLPDMPPLKAYQDAKVLVQGRRLNMIRKLVFLPMALFVLAAVLMVPAIIIWAPLAQWLFFVLTGLGLLVMHAYLYTLYRELLRES